MTEINENQKAKLKELESAIKDAYKSDRYDAVRDLAAQIRAINPEDHIGPKLLAKVEEMKAKALKAEKATKTKQYESMLTKLYKEGNFENFRKLASEFKLFDPESKAIDGLLVKVAMAESEAKRKANEGKIKELEKALKPAFKEARFNDVRNLTTELNKLEPGNKVAAGYLANIKKSEMEANRRENAEKINNLQDAIKVSFKEGRFDEVKDLSKKLAEIDPENSLCKKYLVKVAEIEAKVEKEKTKEVKPAVVTSKAIITPVATVVPKVITPAVTVTSAPAVIQKTPEAPKPAITTQKVDKGNIFGKIFSKKDEPAKPAIVTPKEVIAPVAMVAAAPAAAQKTPETPKPAVTAPKEEKGNIFTRMFEKKEEFEKPKKSIIDTIVAKTEEVKTKAEKKPKVEKEEGAVFISFCKALVQFSVAFIVISTAFFYVQNIDKNNTVLGLFGIEENYASRLHAASLKLEGKKTEESGLNKEIENYKAGYDNKYETIINGIIAKRVAWPDIMAKINEVADYVYARNAISQYIKFDNFSLDTKTGQVRVSGTLSDPLGKNLTKLVELQDAFKYYPKDKDSADDTTKPYFYNLQEFNSLSKSYDSKTGKYTSTFQLSFSLAAPKTK
jgi:hypothetical protein